LPSMQLDSLLSCFALLHPPSPPALFCSAPRLPLILLCFAPLYLGGGGAGGPRRERGWGQGCAFRVRDGRILGASGRALRFGRPGASSRYAMCFLFRGISEQHSTHFKYLIDIIQIYTTTVEYDCFLSYSYRPFGFLSAHLYFYHSSSSSTHDSKKKLPYIQ